MGEAEWLPGLVRLRPAPLCYAVTSPRLHPGDNRGVVPCAAWNEAGWLPGLVYSASFEDSDSASECCSTCFKVTLPFVVLKYFSRRRASSFDR